MYYQGHRIFIAPDDQCMTCEHYARGVRCPLLEALGLGVATLSAQEVHVRNCGMYEPHQRHLQVVGEAPQPPEDGAQREIPGEVASFKPSGEVEMTTDTEQSAPSNIIPLDPH